MPLNADQPLLHYRLIEKIGEGGMGEVWRATDTTLDRDVAIKVLPDSLSQDAERLLRFEREAKLLASLNHSNIAGIYGIHTSPPQAASTSSGQANSGQGVVRFLAMELVPGEDLAERLQRGALPIEEATQVARQIAEALEIAHDQGIIHRDLKPANVKLTPDGTVKVLDFGLAKALDTTQTASGATNSAASPTITSLGTVAGTILGTAAYMSPEQARARSVDRRSDVWSFGVVLLEMLVGRRVFVGETISDTMAAVLRAEIDFDELPAGTPPAMRHLLRRCLERDPRTRLQAIGEARIALEGDVEPLAEPAPPAVRTRTPTWVLGLGLLVAVLAAFVGYTIGRGTGPAGQASAPTRVERFDLSLPADKPLAGGSFLKPFAISPNGSLVVYVGVEQGIRRLYKRPLDSLGAEQMPGTEGAEGPFFSPNGEEVGFWAQGAIKRVPLAGGLPRKIFTTIDYRGATWGADNTIVFTPRQGGPLWRISADGGDARVLTKIAEGEGGHRLPTFLPDGRTFVFGIQAQRFSHETASVGIMSIGDDTHTTILEPTGLDVRYANGHLYHVQGSVLLAAPFDPVKRKVGTAKRVQEGIRVQANTGVAYFDVAPDGTLVYLPGTVAGADGRVAWVDADGNPEFFSDERYILRHPRILQAGKKMSVLFIGRERDGIWISDTETPGFTKILENVAVAWAPDGRRAVLTDWAIKSGWTQVNIIDPFSNAEHEVLLELTEESVTPSCFSPDGSVVLLMVASADKERNTDIVAFDLEDRSRVPFVATEHLEGGGQFSPDGNWVTYVSNQTGQFEVYIVAWPGGGNPRQISTHGGREPNWSADGRQVFYRNGTNMVAVSLGPGPGLQPGKPRVLFEGPYEGLLGTINSPNYAVHPDGRFLMLRSETLAAKMDRIAIARGVLPGSRSSPTPR